MTLLGQFYSRIYGSVEYLASESLLFILNKSKNARACLEQYIRNLTSIKIDNLHYMSQNIGENNERPDISGFSENNIEQLIIETKFWASLTENQPLGYLKRIEKLGGVLLFVCPSIRQNSLMNEIEAVFNNEKYKYEKINEFEFKHDNTITIVSSWDVILNRIKEVLLQNKESETLSDVEQLIGLCEKIDQDSFQPIQKEDLSPKVPRQMIAYNRLIDKTIDMLNSLQGVSTQGLRTTPQVFGYRRYAQINSRITSYNVCYTKLLRIWVPRKLLIPARSSHCKLPRIPVS